MSLLGTQVFANSDTPIWISVNGGSSKGAITAPEFITTPGGDIVLVDQTSVTGMRLVSTSGSTSYIQSSGTIKFGQIGQGTTNTSLVVSAPGANADVFTVGGQIAGGGITPTSSVVGSAIVPLNAGTPTPLTITPAINLVSGGIYDIQVAGYWTVAVGTTTPATADQAVLTLLTGTASSPGLFRFQAYDIQYPALANDPWTSGSLRPFKIRARLPCNANQALSLTPTLTGSGTYPTVSITVSDLTVVRVA